MECNCFIESLDLLLDESKVYSTIIENTYYVQEGNIADFIRNIDFKKIFKFIFDKFIGILSAIWDRFRAAYNRFTSKSVLLKRYKKKLESIDWDVNYSESRSIYTNLDNSTNINMYKMSLDKEYSILIGDLEKISKCNDIGTLHTSILQIRDNMINLDTYLNNKRGEALGSYSGISKEDFAREATLYFKPDRSLAPGVIHPNEVKKITNEYFSAKSIEKVITKDQDSLSKAAKTVEVKMTSISLDKYVPDRIINQEIASVFSEIIRNYCNRIQGLCNIYIQLFSIKLDIFKIYKEEQVKILSKIILQSMKEGKM